MRAQTRYLAVTASVLAARGWVVVARMRRQAAGRRRTDEGDTLEFVLSMAGIVVLVVVVLAVVRSFIMNKLDLIK